MEREPVVLEHEPHVVVECELRRKGVFKVVVVPSWAPVGAERFLNLVDEGFFDGAPLFRAVRGFLVQFGLSSDPEANNRWGHLTLPDDPKQGVRIRRGTLAFAGSGKNSRATQMFIALTDKAWPRLGSEPWETPFAYVPAEDYQAVVSLLNTEYGDIKPFNKQGVDPGKIWRHGMSYLEDGFPNLDYLAYCRRLPKHHLGFADSIMQAQEDFANAAPDDASTRLLYVLAILLAIMTCYIAPCLTVRRRERKVRLPSKATRCAYDLLAFPEKLASVGLARRHEPESDRGENRERSHALPATRRHASLGLGVLGRDAHELPKKEDPQEPSHKHNR
ncbi:Peptidyl-prolyl cis-trans isomerase [Hondaea fermentalgiana]|uniref:peptidylprolyl isomerase n=1 Tax=Hondaea fermentalgiana TaxID=2315210 RepID=A0A2R5GIZ6_9STRA|nr:Peptidyl-prolyl cis-trans isomerase [Hondaea fermentalgiana]|eukprot:GBG30862.1 Peptidyl-prolyl cis-trans isomerase [Hondaea fermentalgiana]